MLSVFDVVVGTMIWTLGALAWVIFMVRIIGLRSLAKMTAFDFVITLATGSLLATAASQSDVRVRLGALVAMATLMATQAGLSMLRNRSKWAAKTLQNSPAVLFWKGHFIEEAMTERRMAREDVLAKLRRADVKRLSDVYAVVLETTGELSVMTGDQISHDLLDDVALPEKKMGKGQKDG